MNIILKCATCGEEIGVVTERNIPLYCVTLYGIAESIGWKPYLDLENKRTVVCCDNYCLSKQFTKNGRIRKRLIKQPREADAPKRKTDIIFNNEALI